MVMSLGVYEFVDTIPLWKRGLFIYATFVLLLSIFMFTIDGSRKCFYSEEEEDESIFDKPISKHQLNQDFISIDTSENETQLLLNDEHIKLDKPIKAKATIVSQPFQRHRDSHLQSNIQIGSNPNVPTTLILSSDSSVRPNEASTQMPISDYTDIL